MFAHRKQRLFLSVYVDDIKIAGKKQNMAPMWETLMNKLDLDEPTSFPDHVSLGCTQRERKVNENVFDQYRENVQITNFCCCNWRNLTPKQLRGPTTWKDMLKSELVNTKTEQLYTVSTGT